MSHFIQIKTKTILKQISNLDGVYGSHQAAGQVQLGDLVEKENFILLKNSSSIWFS